MGYIRGVIHGVIAGAAVGIAIAPQDGARTREQVRVAAERIRRGVDSAQETARRVAPQVLGAAESAGEMLVALRMRVSRQDEAPSGTEPPGSPAPDLSPQPIGAGVAF